MDASATAAWYSAVASRCRQLDALQDGIDAREVLGCRVSGRRGRDDRIDSAAGHQNIGQGGALRVEEHGQRLPEVGDTGITDDGAAVASGLDRDESPRLEQMQRAAKPGAAAAHRRAQLRLRR
jgi:hypothetical protein